MTQSAGFRAQRSSLILLLILAAVLAAYSNSFHVSFLVDNEEIILNDTRVHSASSEHLLRILTGQYWELDNNGLYRPLTTLSFLFNYAILGNATDPVGYHVVNLALHLLNVALVYFLAISRGSTPMPR